MSTASMRAQFKELMSLTKTAEDREIDHASETISTSVMSTREAASPKHVCCAPVSVLGCRRVTYVLGLGRVEVWKTSNGTTHREDGPAHITELAVTWFRHGRRHREEGPAYFVEGGDLKSQTYYLDDEMYLWSLPSSLWAVAAIRNRLLEKEYGKSRLTWDERATRQRARALKLVVRDAKAVDAAILLIVVAEAWASADPELRRWGSDLMARLAVAHMAKPDLRAS